MALMTVSVLFTDVVGSTEIMSRVGEAAADDLRRAHFDRLRRVIVSTSGREVKNLGDGLMVVFDSAASAMLCAAGMQQAVISAPTGREGPERIEVRIGVSAGEVEADDNDYFGAPVVEASRLCAVAGAGEILVSEMSPTAARASNKGQQWHEYDTDRAASTSETIIYQGFRGGDDGNRTHDASVPPSGVAPL